MNAPPTPAELLRQLTLERSSEPVFADPGGSHAKKRIGVGILIITSFLIAAALVYRHLPSRAVVNGDPDVANQAPVAHRRSAEQVSMAQDPIGGGTPTEVLNATGYVVARRAATVSSKVTGKVTDVLIEEGMTVVAGQILARLDDRAEQSQLELAMAQLEAARASAAELDARVAQARTDASRWRRLTARGLAGRVRLEDALAELATLEARKHSASKGVSVAMRQLDVHRIHLEDQQIRAPFDGTVIEKAAQPGEMISPVSAGGGFTRTGICTIVDMNSLEVEVDINEAYINRVAAEQAVSIRLNAYPDSAYPGAVLAVIPTADRNKATIRVRLRLLETDHRVLPNMGVQVAFLDEIAPTHQKGSSFQQTTPAANNRQAVDPLDH